MNAAEFIDHLDRSAPASVYLFHSDSDFLVDELWQRALAQMVPASHRRWNGERMSAKDLAVADVLERLRTIPMMGGRRLLMVQHADQWKKDERKLLEAYVSTPWDGATLVLSMVGKVSWKKLFQTVKTTGILVELKAPTQQTAPRWLQERAMATGKRLPFRAAAALVEQVGPDLHSLEQELAKLCSFSGDRTEITLEDVFEVVSRQRSFGIFELTRYIGSQHPDLAIVALRNLLLAGQSPLPILGLLARHIRLIWQIKDALDRKQNFAEMTKQIHLPGGVVKNYAQQGRSFSYPELGKIHQALVAADLDLKRTALAPERVLEALVLQLCHIAGSGGHH